MDAYITYISPLTGHFVAETTINFYLYKGTQPHVSILDSDAYQERQTTFSITTNEYDSIVSYNLDGGANVTLLQNESASFQDLYAYNISLFGLPVGFHRFTVYAKDAFNQTAVAEKAFTQLPMPLSTIAAITGTAIAIACAAALLLYRKRHAKTL